MKFYWSLPNYNKQYIQQYKHPEKLIENGNIEYAKKRTESFKTKLKQKIQKREKKNLKMSIYVRKCTYKLISP